MCRLDREPPLTLAKLTRKAPHTGQGRGGGGGYMDWPCPLVMSRRVTTPRFPSSRRKSLTVAVFHRTAQCFVLRLDPLTKCRCLQCAQQCCCSCSPALFFERTWRASYYSSSAPKPHPQHTVDVLASCLGGRCDGAEHICRTNHRVPHNNARKDGAQNSYRTVYKTVALPGADLSTVHGHQEPSHTRLHNSIGEGPTAQKCRPPEPGCRQAMVLRRVQAVAAVGSSPVVKGGAGGKLFKLVVQHWQ